MLPSRLDDFDCYFDYNYYCHYFQQFSRDTSTTVSTMNSSNSSVEGKSGPFWCTAFSIEALCILITNLFTITTFYINKHLRKRSTYLLINLSVADLLVGILPLPLYCYFLGIGLISPKSIYHRILYHIYHYSDIFTGLASITSLAFISLERMLATVYPLRHRVTPFRNYVCVIIAIWILNGSIAALTTYFNSYDNYEYALYAAWLPFSFLLSSLIIIITSYSIVFANFRACKGRSVRARRPLGHYKNKKLAKTLFIVTAASLLTWSPFVIIMGIHYYSNTHFSATILYVTKLFHYINSLINTIIYASRMPEFRIALTELVCKRSRIKFGTKPRNTTSLSMSNLGNPLLFGLRNQEEHGLLFMNHRRLHQF